MTSPERSFLYQEWRLSIQDRSKTSNAWHKMSAFSTYMNPWPRGTVYNGQISHHIPTGAPENQTHQAITLTFWDNTSLLRYSMKDIISFIQNCCTQNTKQDKIDYVFSLQSRHQTFVKNTKKTFTTATDMSVMYMNAVLQCYVSC
jgi:hypothetical protein